MAQIKNFGLVGVGTDVQFGKSGPRLKSDLGVFKFRDSSDLAFADVKAANLVADSLSGAAGKVVTVDATGQLTLGALLDNLATDAEVATAVGTETTARTAAVTAEFDRATAAELVLTNNLATETTNRTTAVTAEFDRAVAAELVLTNNLAAEVARAIAAELVLTTATALETSTARAAEGVLTTAVADEVTRATTEEARIVGLIGAANTDYIAADIVLTGAIAAEKAAREAADTAMTTAYELANTTLTTALSAEVDRAVAAELQLTTDIGAEATTRYAADTALSGRITTEVARATGVEGTLATAISDEATRAGTAEVVLGGRIDTEASTRATAITTLSNAIDAKLVGLTWEAPVDMMVADASALSLTGVADGYRIVDTTTHTIFTVTGETLGAGELLVDGAAFFDRTSDVGYMFNGTSVIQFNGAGNIVAGTGLTKSGNTLSITSTSGTITVTEDSIDVAQSVLDSISTVATNLAGEISRAGIAESGLGARIDDEADARDAADVAMTAAYLAADVVIMTALTAEATRATGAESTLTTNLGLEVIRAIAAEDAIATNLTALTSGLVSGGLVFAGAAGTLFTDSGISYDAANDTLTIAKFIVAATAPTLPEHLANKAYVDSALQAVVGSGQVAKGFHIAFADGTTTIPAFAGMVTRIKVKVTTAGASVAIGSMVTADLVDAAYTGLYVVECADENTLAMDIVSVGTAGIVIVEYLPTAL